MSLYLTAYRHGSSIAKRKLYSPKPLVNISFVDRDVASTKTHFQPSNLQYSQTLPSPQKRFYAIAPPPSNPDALQQIKDNNGAIWISNTYLLGRWMNVTKFLYSIRGKKEEFQRKIHKDVANSFDELLFPGLRQIIPSFKEGGCYVVFASKEQAKQVLAELKNLVEIAGLPRKAYLIQGKPFIEDLSHVQPSHKLVVELVDPAKSQQKLSPELLYHELRPYGRMQDIVVDAKRESAVITFTSTSSAIAARNCLHLKTIGDSKFNTRYEPFSRITQIMDILKNPRFLIPILGIGITLSLYLLVEPTRVASVTQKITRGYRDEDKIEEHDVENLREDQYLSLYKYSRTEPDGSIMVITGASGSGKSLLVKRVMNNRRLTVHVNCRNLKTVQEFIELFGTSIGFSPSFNALNTILNWLESFIPGLKKTALSPSTKIQIESMLQTLNSVLYIISAGYPAAGREFDYPIIAFDGFHEMLDNWDSSSNEAEREKSKELVEILLRWATHNAKTTHIIFTGENVFGEELLLQHPSLKKSKVALKHIYDLPVHETAKFLKSKFPKSSNEDISHVLSILGGRISDIEAYISRLSIGNSPQVALQNLISEAEQEIRISGFGGKMLASSSTKKWTQVQLWKAIKQIVDKQTVKYDELLFSAFGGDNEALRALIKHKILSAEKQDGNFLVSAFSPLYFRAFEKLVKESPKLRRGLDMLALKADIAKDMEEINKAEEELIKLRNAEEGSSYESEAVRKRRQFLHNQLLEFNSRVEKKEAELRAVEKS